MFWLIRWFVYKSDFNKVEYVMFGWLKIGLRALWFYGLDVLTIKFKIGYNYDKMGCLFY